MRDKNKTRIGDIVIWMLLVLGALLMLFPFVWTVVTSITPGGSLSSTPSLIVRDPTLDAYRKLAETVPIWRIIVNSFGIAIVSTLLQLLTGSLAAYGFSRLEFPGKKFVFGCYLATLMIPLQVLVVPLFIRGLCCFRGLGCGLW